MNKPRKNRFQPDLKDLSYGDHPKQCMDIWWADAAETNDRDQVPTLIWFHGGAFNAGDKSEVPKALLKGARERGMMVISIGYRLSQHAPVPAAMYDAAVAMDQLLNRDLLGNDSKCHIHDEQLFLSGNSAGAGIALWLAWPPTEKQHLKIQRDPPDPMPRFQPRALALFNAQPTYDPRVISKILGIDAFDSASLFAGAYGLSPDQLHTPEAHALYDYHATLKNMNESGPPIFSIYTQPPTENRHKADATTWWHDTRFGDVLKKHASIYGTQVILRNQYCTDQTVPPITQMLDWLQTFYHRSHT